MIPLSALLSAISVEEIIGSTDIEITSVESDSRKIKLGSLFVAVRGTVVDGHTFIPIVTGGGAAAIVCEELPERLESEITYIKVSNSAVALGFLASRWYGDPSRKLKLVGVTQTVKPLPLHSFTRWRASTDIRRDCSLPFATI